MPPKPIRRRKSNARKRRSSSEQTPLVRRAISLVVPSVRRDTCERKYKNFVEGKSLGKGLFGNVHELCEAQKPEHCPYVLKAQPVYLDAQPGVQFVHVKEDLFVATVARFEHEVRLQRVAHDLKDLAPNVLDAWICPPEKTADPHTGVGFIVSERVTGSLVEIGLLEKTPTQRMQVAERAERLIEKLHKIGIQHQDIHPGNILFRQMTLPKGRSTYQLLLTDFGTARLNDEPMDPFIEEEFGRNDKRGITKLRQSILHPEKDPFLNPIPRTLRLEPSKRQEAKVPVSVPPVPVLQGSVSPKFDPSRICAHASERAAFIDDVSYDGLVAIIEEEIKHMDDTRFYTWKRTLAETFVQYMCNNGGRRK